MTKPDAGKIEKLPRWAQDYIRDLERVAEDAPAQPLQKKTQQLPDETFLAAVKCVERETRQECAAMVREISETPSAQALGIGSAGLRRLADAMERGE